jgi:hypothetical protein
MVDQEYIEHMAERHWEYTKNIIIKTKEIEETEVVMLDLMHYIYVASFIHGYKHAEDDSIEV